MNKYDLTFRDIARLESKNAVKPILIRVFAVIIFIAIAQTIIFHLTPGAL